MAGKGRTMSGLRAIAAPFVVPAPKGARTRTRLHVTDEEAAALREIGAHLGGIYRATLADLLAQNPATGKDKAVWRAKAKKAGTGASSSRWMGAITRTALDARRLGIDNLYRERRSLTAAVETIGARMAVPCGHAVPGDHPRAKPVRGYKDQAERFQKSRRKAVLADRLAKVEDRIATSRPRIVVGGGRLWSTRANLDQAGLTEAQWGGRWADERLFLTADGESGQVGGNQTIRVTEDGAVTIKVPAALVDTLGKALTVAAPVTFATHLGDQWAMRIQARQAIRYDIHVTDRGRWYVDASWGYKDAPSIPLASLQAQRTLGVDLNNGHADAAVIDEHGNVIGTPERIDFEIAGTTSRRDAQVRHLITRLIRLAKTNRCASISIENLGFTDARTVGRETMGRGTRGRTFRRTVAGIPTARFRDRLAAMAATAGLMVITVDPAYTSAWAKQHWLQPLQATDPDIDGHRAAAVVIGRRSLGHRARRKPLGPRTQQRMSAGQPAGTVTPGPRPSSRPATRPPTPPRTARPRTPSTRERSPQHRSVGTVSPSKPPGSLPLTA
jgi:hypothetical protein